MRMWYGLKCTGSSTVMKRNFLSSDLNFRNKHFNLSLRYKRVEVTINQDYFGSFPEQEFLRSNFAV